MSLLKRVHPFPFVQYELLRIPDFLHFANFLLLKLVKFPLIELLPLKHEILMSLLVFLKPLFLLQQTLLVNFTPQNNLSNFFLRVRVKLVILKFLVVRNNILHQLLIWQGLGVVMLNNLGRLLNVLPALHFLVKTDVS